MSGSTPPPLPRLPLAWCCCDSLSDCPLRSCTADEGETARTDPSSAAAGAVATTEAALDSDGGFPVFAPVTVTGTGAEVVPLPADSGIITASYTGSGLFRVSVLDTAGELANVGAVWYGAYEGTVYFGMFAPGHPKPHELSVTADGEWKITIAPAEDAPVLSGPVDGRGDAVFFYAGGATEFDVAFVGGDTGFTVDLDLPGDGEGARLISSMGDDEETMPVPEGPLLLSVRGIEEWSIRPA